MVAIALLLVLGVLLFVVAPVVLAVRGRGARRAVLALVGVTAVAVVVGVVAVVGGFDDEPQVAQIERVRALDATTLEIEFVGGECDGRRTAEADEQDRAVTLTVSRSSVADECSDVAVTHTVTADLDSPLGDRDVVDASCDCAVRVE